MLETRGSQPGGPGFTMPACVPLPLPPLLLYAPPHAYVIAFQPVNKVPLVQILTWCV